MHRSGLFSAGNWGWNDSGKGGGGDEGIIAEADEANGQLSSTLTGLWHTLFPALSGQERTLNLEGPYLRKEFLSLERRSYGGEDVASREKDEAGEVGVRGGRIHFPGRGVWIPSVTDDNTLVVVSIDYDKRHLCYAFCQFMKFDECDQVLYICWQSPRAPWVVLGAPTCQAICIFMFSMDC